MTRSNSKTITIVQRPKDECQGEVVEAYDLIIDGGKRAAAEKLKSRNSKIRFYPAGAVSVQEATSWVQGLMNLIIKAEEWDNEG